MWEVLWDSVKGEFTFSSSTAILLLFFLFMQERRDKREVVEDKNELTAQLIEQAESHAAQLHDVTRTLDKVLASTGLIMKTVNHEDA